VYDLLTNLSDILVRASDLGRDLGRTPISAVMKLPLTSAENARTDLVTARSQPAYRGVEPGAPSLAPPRP
jgi:hypothetical protein